MFMVGCEYTRDEIQAELGGSKVSSLPTREGKIVAACLSRKFSPAAPAVVLCGQGQKTGPVRIETASNEPVVRDGDA